MTEIRFLECGQILEHLAINSSSFALIYFKHFGKMQSSSKATRWEGQRHQLRIWEGFLSSVTTVSRSKLQRAQMTRLKKKKTSTQEYEYYDHDRRCVSVIESCLLCPPHSGRRCSAMTVGGAARKSSVSATYRLLSSVRILCGDNLRGRGYVAGK